MTASAFPGGFTPFPSMGDALSRAVFPGGPPNQPNTFDCSADRMIPAGGALASHLLHPDAKPFSRIRRLLSSSGMYQASKSRPFQATVFAFQVPHEMILALSGATTRPYTFDPLAPGDAVPLDDRRLALTLGYDLTFSVVGRMGNIEAGVIPVPSDPSIATNVSYPTLPAASVGFPPLPSKPTNGDTSLTIQAISELGGATQTGTPQFAGIPSIGTPSNPNQFVLTASGGAVQPQTQDPKQGPADMPFTYLVQEGEAVTMSVVAFGPIRIPLAFVEAVLVGYLLPKTNLEALIQRMRPCG